jgi:hypothetical protein
MLEAMQNGSAVEVVDILVRIFFGCPSSSVVEGNITSYMLFSLLKAFRGPKNIVFG